MAAPSPESTDAACERVRLAYRAWAPQERRPPAREAVLTRGQSNTTILLAGETGRWALRIAPSPAPLGVCRDREAAVHRLAAAAGLAPRLCFAEPASGILVTEYQAPDAGVGPGSAESTAEARSDGSDEGRDTAAIGCLLRAVHELDAGPETAPVLGPALDSVQRLTQWRRSLGRADPLTTLDKISGSALSAALGRLAGAKAEAVLCHNDLLAANRLRRDDRLIAIDWEYACSGDAAFDLAVTASELHDAAGEELLRAYLQRSPTATEAQRLRDQQLVYLAIASCWYASQRAPRAAVAVSLDALRRRCRAQGNP